ncbi:DUSP19 [Symbiodinium sp. KB8]|nr:DUSP19 [Symbiodinium sp. KB8]
MERRVDPADGGSYTFQDLSRYYAKQYSKQEIQHYWSKQCKPLAPSTAVLPAEDPPDLARLAQAKVCFCPDPKTSGASFTPIFESSSNGKNFASVNAGNPKKLKVGGGTINGQFAQELHRVAGHDPDSYSPAHEALLRVAVQAGTARHGLVQAPASLRLPPCLEAAFIYLGRTLPEAEQIAGDSGRGGLVILDIFETKSRPYHDQNVAMVYTVGPQRGFEPDDATFLSKVRLVGRNVAAACHDYNMQRSSQAPAIDQVRLCLVSGGKFAERVPKEHVARQLVLGVLDVQLAEWIRPEAMPEIEFAYDGDVFRKEWDAVVERT